MPPLARKRTLTGSGPGVVAGLPDAGRGLRWALRGGLPGHPLCRCCPRGGLDGAPREAAVASGLIPPSPSLLHLRVLRSRSTEGPQLLPKPPWGEPLT